MFPGIFGDESLKLIEIVTLQRMMLETTVSSSEDRDEWMAAVERRAEEARRARKRLVVRFEDVEKNQERDALRDMYAAIARVSPRLDAVPRFVDRKDGDHDEVAVGGTFDRLHAGHRLLLAACALCCRKKLYVGIAGDGLLRKKALAETIEPIDERSKGVLNFLHSMRSDLEVVISVLADPAEPTKASTVSSITALVVSRETMKGAEKVAEVRKKLGVEPPLEFVVVGLVGGDNDDDDDDKLSSSKLRAQDHANTASKN